MQISTISTNSSPSSQYLHDIYILSQFRISLFNVNFIRHVSSSLEYTCVLAICSKVAPIIRFNQRSVHRIRGNRCQHHPNPFLQRSFLPFFSNWLFARNNGQPSRPSLFYQRLTRFVSFTLIYLFFLHPVSLLILRRLEKGRRNGEGSFFASIFFFFFFLFEVEERFVNEDR